MANPSTEHDWIIHSINIHGVFFERSCQETIAKTGQWKVKSVNYPVEFPPPNGPWRGKESALDIRAEFRQGNSLLTFLFECKKNNPEFVNWIFFPKHFPGTTRKWIIRQIDNIPRQPPVSGWDVSSSMRENNVTLAGIPRLPFTDEARETRGTYLQNRDGNKTKTSNAAIQDAAYQITLAMAAISSEENFISGRLASLTPPPPLPWHRQIILPAIVTTAKIFTCDFTPSDVDMSTGEIPFEKATLNEQPYLIYEYAIPRHLQSAPNDIRAAINRETADWFTHLRIVVVQSKNLAKMLDDFATSAAAMLI